MKKFLIKISFYCFVALILHVTVGFLADGHTDAYYAKVSSGKKQSLIIGTSRAAQGIIPSIVEDVGELPENSLYNFSFTVSHSPYGKSYLKQIKNKVEKLNESQLFILAVDPWSLASVKGDANNEDLFFEKDLFLSDLNNNSSNPNYEYLIKNYGYGWGNLILNKMPNKAFDLKIHEDGWLEVNIPNDSLAIASRTDKKEKIYREEKLPVTEISDKRMSYLKKTIEYLSQIGDVMLVRLPVGEVISQMEDEIDPEFDSKMKTIAAETDATFVNYRGLVLDVAFTDGNHLDRASAKKFSRILGLDVKHYLKTIK